MTDELEFSSQDLIAEFRKPGPVAGPRALKRFAELSSEQQVHFLEPMLEFLDTEKSDGTRSWAPGVLEKINDPRSIKALTSLLTDPGDDDKKSYPYTRFFTVRALSVLQDRTDILELVSSIAHDEEEAGQVQAGAIAFIAQEDEDAQTMARNVLVQDPDSAYWAIREMLYALRHFPVRALSNDLIDATRSTYPDLKRQAIRALGWPHYSGVKVLRRLGDLLITEWDDYVRLEAVNSLHKIGDPEARDDILLGLEDSNAAVRVEAADALQSVVPTIDEAVSAIVQRALAKSTTPQRRLFVEALRHVDEDRSVSTAVLGKELMSEDRARADRAQALLVDLGGWAAVQRLTQRRATLKDLDQLLRNSEDAVRNTFKGHIRQARVNFYFAMAVNVLIVLTGIVLIVLAVSQLITDPTKLEAWIIPGTAGVLGVILSLFFNNPRNNARDDLRTLLNVNVIFLGYLRQINVIDATFKHAYLESEFDPEDMDSTVTAITETVTTTLQEATAHLTKREPANDGGS